MAKLTGFLKSRVIRCEQRLKGRRGINRFAICRASVLGTTKRKR